MLVLVITTHSYFNLYRKKNNPDYPLLPGEQGAYLSKNPSHFLKPFLTPLFMWKIIFEKHKDEELDTAAKNVRYSVYLFIGIAILKMLLPF